MIGVEALVMANHFSKYLWRTGHDTWKDDYTQIRLIKVNRNNKGFFVSCSVHFGDTYSGIYSATEESPFDALIMICKQILKASQREAVIEVEDETGR